MAPQSPQRELDAIAQAAERIGAAAEDELRALKTALLGRKAGRLTAVLRGLAELSPAVRREVGRRANQLKHEIETAIAAREAELAGAARRPAEFDGTMPGRAAWRGAVHPVTAVVDEICDIFRTLGFTRVTGTEAETVEYNFTKLNTSLDHPAADMQDTFYLGPDVVLRTHTSPMQARTMERYPPPIRIVVPGRVYRRDDWDPSHAPVFEQIEGLAVDEGIDFADFKATIGYFVERFFSPQTTVRLRPSFFPFTEPSAEVEVQCVVCGGGGCSTCKQTGYLEIMGAGMVHPAVFEACGIDAERYAGWAFGMGVDRIAMLRYGVPDIRMFSQSDMRFLAQLAE